MTDRKEISRLEAERAEDRALIRSLNARIIELAQAANAARDEVEALRKDAERYRWVRQYKFAVPDADELDRAVDLFMSKEAPSV